MQYQWKSNGKLSLQLQCLGLKKYQQHLNNNKKANIKIIAYKEYKINQIEKKANNV